MSVEPDGFLGKYGGNFHLDYQDGREMDIDDVVTFIVTGVVSAEGNKPNKDGEIIRTFTIAVADALPIPMSKVAPLKSAVTTGDITALRDGDAPLFEVDPDDLDEELSV